MSFDHPAGGERATVPAWDASLGGMFLETSSPLDEGALIALEIGTPETTISVDARVLWTRATKLGEDQPAGMAVRFIDLPDDVSVALSRALQSGMQERTILGVGGGSKEPTQIGIAPGIVPVAPGIVPAAPGVVPAAPAPVARVPRETQIGIAPPANLPAKEPSLAPVPEAPVPKPRLVLSDTSLPGTPVPIKVDVPDHSRLEETAPSRARSSLTSELPPLPVSRLASRLFLFFVFVGSAAAVYLYREPIARMIAPPPPTPAPLESSKPSPPLADAAALGASDGSASVSGIDVHARDAATLDAAVLDAGGRDKDAGPHDAGAHDAGRADGGARDGGAHDAGLRDAGKHDAGRAPAKHP